MTGRILLSVLVIPVLVFGKSAKSPDGRNLIEYVDGHIRVCRDGRTLFGPQPIALDLDRGKAEVELVARNDGVAYRFTTDEDGEITVKDETCALVFPDGKTEIWTGYNWRDNPKNPKQDKLQHGCASVYVKTTPGEFVPDGRRIAYLPLTVRFKDGTTVLFSESDLRDYAGMHLRRDGGESRRLDGVFGKFPVREKEWTAPRNYRRVKAREDFIVKTTGRRTFPWRVFAIADRPIGIAEQTMVYDLAKPSEGDWSWVRPGTASWEWWNDWHLENVPFKPGINTETYKAYIDFAAEYGLEWMLVDEGWKDGDDFNALAPGFDLDAIVAYADSRNVQLMLWTAWRALDGCQEEIFSRFAKRGVKGFKIDFMERDDAAMMRFIEKTLQVAAKYRLCIDFHGCGKPTGLEKTYPNLIGIEGVHGLELMKLKFAEGDVFPSHECRIVYTRGPLGMVDYTPGAMTNRRLKDWKADNSNPASIGTRVRQMAMYTLYEVPFQTLCDSPSRYRKNPECTRFIADVPVVWDETKGLAGEIGEFAALARRKGSEWWAAAITDLSARSVTIDTSFLAPGRWRAEIFADAGDAAEKPEHWTRTVAYIESGCRLEARLAPAGGWTARFTPVAETGIFVEAEAFGDVGGWTVDCQHALQMGSPYLLAHGLGKPVADAKTHVVSENGGVYRLWVRTRNWTAPWTSAAAGRFRVRVNGTDSGVTYGTGSSDWRWCGGKECRLVPGKNEIAIVDETGFDGRVDAIALTLDGECPEALMSASRAARAVEAPETVKADLVVTGGGVAGICAALAAARSGLSVALVQDRPVLGGNNSSEVRVHMGGHQQCGEYPHLGDIVAEISPEEGGNAREAAAYEDERKIRIVRAEKNIALYLNTKADSVEMKDGLITAVGAVDVKTGRRLRFTAPLFVDATGDGTIGYLAGADYRVGRESLAETGEKNAPVKADKLTMGSSCQWRAVRREGDTGFPSEKWMLDFNDKSATVQMKGDWNWETGLGRDQIAEAERIRDYGMLVAYSNWSFVKNRSKRRARFADAALEWVASVAGKRESRRLLGDVILDETDVLTARPYPDGTCLTSWSIDLHYPKTEEQTHFKGESFRTWCEQRRVALYPIPFGCFYSRNVGNLFMAGRNISVTHIVLGTVRVMRTTGMMGEVVGLAAAVCKEKGCLPRAVRSRWFADLAARMKRGAGAGNVWSRQEYNVHPSLGLNLNDPAAVERSLKRKWSNVDHFRGLTVSEPGEISNAFLRVTASADGYAAYRAGENRPFARWGHAGSGAEMRVRLDDANPFVYVDVAPLATDADRKVDALDLPEIGFECFSGEVSVRRADGSEISSVNARSGGCVALVGSGDSRCAAVLGWLTNFRCAGGFSSVKNAKDGSVSLKPVADYRGMTALKSRKMPFDTFLIGTFKDGRGGVEAAVSAVADRFAVGKRDLEKLSSDKPSGCPAWVGRLSGDTAK